MLFGLVSRHYFNILRFTPVGKQMLEQLRSGLKMNAADFEARWTAD